ncbi:aromatic acid exporter family protein [Halobacillus litoralis]|uniref:Aromatic acid exporter family protein n=1 Tax=Halobacillus litoralis TaxID=45668 RepID=A0A845E1X9_9BACI|nr:MULTISPECIES: aromatic acid exporter family protein [Halobacillus]MYL19704.1 aromatic acid exporter family protein [Halobacillus litoralis]MYL28850.1 aromatic acid exporter family protein [Halobacillus halophilus]
MKIGYRTIKTALGTPFAIWVAQMLQLDNFASAGILTILCIQITRKRSFLSAWHRFSACIVAMAFSYTFFELIGYNPLAIGIMLFAFIPVTVWLNITPGIVTSSVIILHLYGSGNIGWDIILNEVVLITVGIGTALLLNLYMPSLENKLGEYRSQVERNFSLIMKELATFLRDGDNDWTGRELTDTAELLEKAKSLSYRDVENHLLRTHNHFYHYFHMRTKQFELLERMLPLVSRISASNMHSSKIADFFDDLAEGIHPGNTAVIYLQQFKEMKEEFREDELPQTREEFEMRASLFHLLNEIEEYLIIKRSFKKSDV